MQAGDNIIESTAEILDASTYASHAKLSPNLSTLDSGGSSVSEHDACPSTWVLITKSPICQINL